MSTEKMYDIAKEIYGGIGVDTEAAIKKLEEFTLSIHCWQGDDVTGFENSGAVLDGGLAATGNHPGKAKNPIELRADMEKAFSMIPGKKKAGIHAMYLESDKKIDRDAIEPKHFEGWINWAKEQNIGIDFNPTFFSHPKASDGFTLSSGDESIRKFWVEHNIRSCQIAEYIGKELGIRSINNIWIPDGYKDTAYDKTAPRKQLIKSLDETFAIAYNQKYVGNSLESKLFGIGSEAYVTGSHEFYMGYTVTNQDKNVMLTMDAGHYHPTEMISAKISSMLLFVNEMLLHVSRPVRWDSDHVVIMDDELMAIAQEIVRGGYEKQVHVALDYFDASINRIAAWVIGSRNTLKAMLKAYLEPVEMLKKAELDGDLTMRLAMVEELKSYPFDAVWDKYCEMNNVPVRNAWISEVKAYEKEILTNR